MRDFKEECNRLPCTPDLASLKVQFSKFELRIPEPEEQSLPVPERRNLLFLYEPWILCDSEREILKSLNI
nr:hypothetical protein CFP56_73084 [Quercus suber]